MPEVTLEEIGSTFGKATKAKLSNPSAVGEPEDQLRNPLEQLIKALAELSGLPKNAVELVGESSLSNLKTRPDFAVTVHNALCGFIEVKRPGKGADPRDYSGHDKQQWERLQPLPNLIYTDGNEWSLWRYGELHGEIVRVKGDVRKSGGKLELPSGLVSLIDSFTQWQPQAPTDAQQLARTTARLCKLLRSEVTEQVEAGNPALTELAAEWRKLLFPEATDAAFADGYAQAVTFGLLMARARGIKLKGGLAQVATELRNTNSLIGTALRLLTDEAESRHTLTTSLQTLVRVLDVVVWNKISKGSSDAWLYFYEGFLAEYDNDLRKKTGSYYTPPEIVTAMVRLVHDALVTRFRQSEGLASHKVTIADPAVGTGTFPLGVLRQVAETVRTDQGDGAVAGAVEQAMGRLIGFEMQLGPFAVAQLRLMGELQSITGRVPRTPLRMYVTDTLGNPYVETEDLGTLTKAIAESRREANKIKKGERIQVVIGNPPYKDKAMGRGGWIEAGGSGQDAPLNAWIPPSEWKVGADAKHLRNLYIYFWRWATWKVFDQFKADGNGVVCFITVAGFLNGRGFQAMRDYLRRTATELWVIDCTPEGHQPAPSSRVFQGVQQPVCIVLAARTPASTNKQPATVHYRALPAEHRDEKFRTLSRVGLDDGGWQTCPSGWRDPFLPAATGVWASCVPLEEMFLDNASGVMPGRTWIIAPDSESLVRRWDALIRSRGKDKETLFHPHLRDGKLGDKHTNKIVKQGLGTRPARVASIAEERGACIEPIGYGFRSFDRQWIIPDPRLINQPNPELWKAHSDAQVYLTALMQHSPRSGPAVTFSAQIPDLHHYKGSFGGRAFALWTDAAALQPNLSPALVNLLTERLGRRVTTNDLFAYIAALAANPTYTERFQAALTTPGLRIPLTAVGELFDEAVSLGREVVWLHTFGERFVDAAAGRPAGPPRLPKDNAPRIPRDGAIPTNCDDFPDELRYSEAEQTLHVGQGRILHVPPAVWNYEVSGKHVLTQWFSYRRRARERPIMGDRRPPSPLGDIQPDSWPAEYTTELLNVLHVLGRLILLEPVQARLLEAICSGPLLSPSEFGRLAELNEVERRERRAPESGLFGPSRP